MPRPAALLVALLASVAAAQQSINVGLGGKPPKNQRPAGPVKPNENFPWRDPFTAGDAAAAAAAPACAAVGTFAAREFLLDDLELDAPLGLGPYTAKLRGFFSGRPYPGGWDGLDPHGYDRNVVLMDGADVPSAVRAWIRDQEAADDRPGNGLFAVWPHHDDPAKEVVIFAPGAVYGILPLWVAEGSDCPETLLDMSKYTPEPTDASVVGWVTAHTKPKRSADERNMTFTVKVESWQKKKDADTDTAAQSGGSDKDEL